MNKEKTAMQLLIEEMQDKFKTIEYSHNPYHYVMRSSMKELIEIAKSLLQKEQEQIEKAFEAGVRDVFDSAFDKNKLLGTGTNYYQSKYGGEAL